MVDVGDVENFETAGTVCGIKIFAAQPDVLNVVAAVFVGFIENRTAFEMLLVIRGIGDRLKVTSDHGLRFIRLGPNHGVQTFFAFADVGVAAKKIHRAGAEPEELRHPRVVVIVLRQMAVGAILGRADAARRVWKMRIECLTAVAFR